jgi:hypothetical protein
LKLINTEIRIKSSPQIVWEILTDFDDYQNWNPFISNIRGKAIINANLEISISTSSGKNRLYHPIITKFEPFRELRWKGKSTLPFMFDGERIFLLEDNQGQVNFIHKEIFTGFGTLFVGKKFESDLKDKFNQMNNALKEKVESKQHII